MLKGKEGREGKDVQKERRKRGSRKYGQAKLKHSKMGIQSCGYGGGAAMLLAFSILISFLSEGMAAGFIGGFGVVTLVLAGLGIRAAIKGLREREKNYITCKIGMGISIAFLLGVFAIFIGGIFR